MVFFARGRGNASKAEEMQKIEAHEEDMARKGDFDYRLISYEAKHIARLCRGRILEIGGGRGTILKELVNKFSKISVVEPSSEHYRYLLKRFGDSVRAYNVLGEEFDTVEKFDTIIMSHILEHVKNPRKLLRKMKNLLSDNGKVLVVTPNSESIHRRLGKIMGIIRTTDQLDIRDIMVGHRRIYNMETLSKDIIKSGLRIKSKGGFLFKPFPNAEMAKLSRKRLLAFFRLGNEFAEYCADIWFLCTK